MANELSLEFKVETTTSLQKLIENELTDYHHKWQKRIAYSQKMGLPENYDNIMHVEEKEPLAA